MGLLYHIVVAQCCGLNGVPGKDTLQSNPMVPVQTPLFGNKVFADITKVN